VAPFDPRWIRVKIVIKIKKISTQRYATSTVNLKPLTNTKTCKQFYLVPTWVWAGLVLPWQLQSMRNPAWRSLPSVCDNYKDVYLNLQLATQNGALLNIFSSLLRLSVPIQHTTQVTSTSVLQWTHLRQS
jgi:hypothetical protein